MQDISLIYCPVTERQFSNMQYDSVFKF